MERKGRLCLVQSRFFRVDWSGGLPVGSGGRLRRKAFGGRSIVLRRFGWSLP
ncbi:hypothetical protein BRO54_1105 [Geobacillus proteiniphilus]|uniref:Uncharacterized protein n=1 Tax=Geobacillus proteiniphilus TaxID=860353 RepID=A0A1Q5T4D9_9BACL|nr:hypothetical protein BRO54_1105 [Geobacillus proteiniphilus]